MAENWRHKQRRIHQFHRCDFIKKTSSQRKHTYRTAYSNADTDGDGKITSIDLSYLKRYVLRLISSFPGETSNNLNIPWDWVGIIGTGQSLSVGTTPILSTTQPYNNLKLDLGNLRVPPYDANSSELKLVPLPNLFAALQQVSRLPTQGTYMVRPP